MCKSYHLLNGVNPLTIPQTGVFSNSSERFHFTLDTKKLRRSFNVPQTFSNDFSQTVKAFLKVKLRDDIVPDRDNAS